MEKSVGRENANVYEKNGENWSANGDGWYGIEGVRRRVRAGAPRECWRLDYKV